MNSYTNSVPVEFLTPGELAANSHRADVQRHYEHLNLECKDGIVRECYLCHPVEVICDRCFVKATATIPQHRRNGWLFGLGGDANLDCCPDCAPSGNAAFRPKGEWRAA